MRISPKSNLPFPDAYLPRLPRLSILPLTCPMARSSKDVAARCFGSSRVHWWPWAGDGAAVGASMLHLLQAGTTTRHSASACLLTAFPYTHAHAHTQSVPLPSLTLSCPARPQQLGRSTFAYIALPAGAAYRLCTSSRINRPLPLPPLSHASLVCVVLTNLSSPYHLSCALSSPDYIYKLIPHLLVNYLATSTTPIDRTHHIRGPHSNCKRHPRATTVPTRPI